MTKHAKKPLACGYEAAGSKSESKKLMFPGNQEHRCFIAAETELTETINMAQGQIRFPLSTK